MGKGLIFETRNIEDDGLLEKIDKAVLAAAFKVRDDARNAFLSSKSQYKYATTDYDRMAEGIMVGKLNSSTNSVKVHALGDNRDPDLWKARFFVGSTIYRTQTKQQGKSLDKPYTKGYIKSNDAIDKAINQNQNTLNEFISNTLNNNNK